MTGWPRLAVTAVPVAAACAFLALWAIGRKEIRIQAIQLQGLGKAHAEAEGRVQALEAQNAALRAQLEATGIRPAAVPVPARAPSSTSSVEAVRLLARTEQQMVELKASLQTSQTRVFQLEAALAQTQADNKKLAEAASEAREQADSQRRLNESIEAELKTKTERAETAEALAHRAQADSGDARQKLSQTVGTLRELDDLARRRDNYLASLQRRYRDAADQLRAISNRLDRARDNNAPANISADLPRLQSLIQGAEEDLRQVQTLNAQAQNVTKRLPQR